MVVKTKHTPVKTHVSTRTPATRAFSPFEEMERMFENVLPRSFGRSMWEPSFTRAPMFEGRVPPVDVIDRDDEILVRTELPGVDKKDLEISMTDNLLNIKGVTRLDEEEETGDFYRCEIARGAFSRNITLPGEVDSNKAQATLTDGVLELVIPKVEKAKRQTIAIK